MTTNIRAYDFTLSREFFEKKRAHKGTVLWVYGLSGSGKSTIADAFIKKLSERNILCKSLDGDSLRLGLCNDLGFLDADREENIRRSVHVAKLFCDFGVICVASFITPKKKLRALAKSILEEDFIECYVKAPFELCKARDPKGFYKRAQKGEIKNYTGLSSSFEIWEESADLILDTEKESLDALVEKMLSFIIKKGIVNLSRDKGCSSLMS